MIQYLEGKYRNLLRDNMLQSERHWFSWREDTTQGKNGSTEGRTDVLVGVKIMYFERAYVEMMHFFRKKKKKSKV